MGGSAHDGYLPVGHYLTGLGGEDAQGWILALRLARRVCGRQLLFSQRDDHTPQRLVLPVQGDHDYQDQKEGQDDAKGPNKNADPGVDRG